MKTSCFAFRLRAHPRGPRRFGVAAMLFLMISGAALAQPLVNPLPAPRDVPGKVLSDWILTGDQQSNGIPNPHMTREWMGDGTTMDSLDYTNSLVGLGVPGGVFPDVDALANIGDLFFKQVRNDFATLLTSPRELQNANPGLNEIYFQTATQFGSLAGVWAKNAPDIGGAPPVGDNIPPEGIDGLEVWGGSGDHNMFSLYGDPADQNDPLLRGISVFIYDPVNDVSAPYIYNDEIRTAIGLAPGDPDVDLDGMMMSDHGGDGVFSQGDSILFTVAENGQFHGGEIWVWDFGSPAAFLFHGGVLWDTANQPALIFSWFDASGAPMNDINALEAILVVPEPGSVLLMTLALAAMLAVWRRR